MSLRTKNLRCRGRRKRFPSEVARCEGCHGWKDGRSRRCQTCEVAGRNEARPREDVLEMYLAGQAKQDLATRLGVSRQRVSQIIGHFPGTDYMMGVYVGVGRPTPRPEAGKGGEHAPE
jgi:hypothetical protein